MPATSASRHFDGATQYSATSGHQDCDYFDFFSLFTLLHFAAAAPKMPSRPPSWLLRRHIHFRLIAIIAAPLHAQQRIYNRAISSLLDFSAAVSSRNFSSARHGLAFDGSRQPIVNTRAIDDTALLVASASQRRPRRHAAHAADTLARIAADGRALRHYFTRDTRK